jgi:ABC-2 type transport system permease protein
MTTMTEPTAPAPPPYPADQRVTQARVLRSEWTKLRSLPSTAWSLLTTVVLIVGFSAVYSMVRVTRPPRQPADVASFDPTAVSLSGVHLAQLAIGVLGVLLITGEYATGMIRTSLAAVPRRLPVLWGKAIAFALTTLALCVPATFAAFLLGQSILSAERLDTTLGHPGAARAVLGSALYLTAVGLLGLGLGALLRNTAGAISALFGVLFAFQIVAGFLPNTWSDEIYKYLPTPAGVAVTNVRPDPTSLGPWTGFGLFCLYTAVVLGLAAWQLGRRDA